MKTLKPKNFGLNILTLFTDKFFRPLKIKGPEKVDSKKVPSVHCSPTAILTVLF